MTEPRTCLCPVCWHGETMESRLGGYESTHDDPAKMRWNQPSGAGGQVCTRWDQGFWVCDQCGARLTPHDAGIMLDAALRESDPDCDSIRDGMHEDVRVALDGPRYRGPNV